MSRRALTGQDNPGEFQAIRDEVVAPFKHLLEATARGAGAGAGPAHRGQGEEKRKEGQGRGLEERCPLQAITNQQGAAQRPTSAPHSSGSKARGGESVRLALASAVYEASYMSGCLAFPWDLAMPELNALKAAATAKAVERTADPKSV